MLPNIGSFSFRFWILSPLSLLGFCFTLFHFAKFHSSTFEKVSVNLYKQRIIMSSHCIQGTRRTLILWTSCWFNYTRQSCFRTWRDLVYTIIRIPQYSVTVTLKSNGCQHNFWTQISRYSCCNSIAYDEVRYDLSVTYSLLNL